MAAAKILQDPTVVDLSPESYLASYDGTSFDCEREYREVGEREGGEEET